MLEYGLFEQALEKRLVALRNAQASDEYEPHGEAVKEEHILIGLLDRVQLRRHGRSPENTTSPQIEFHSSGEVTAALGAIEAAIDTIETYGAGERFTDAGTKQRAESIATSLANIHPAENAREQINVSRQPKSDSSLS